MRLAALRRALTYSRLFIGLAVAVPVAVVLAWALPASAHTLLVSAEPEPGTQLQESPREIRLIFNEPLQDGSTLVLYGSNFRDVEGVDVAVAPDAPEQMLAAVPLLEADQYTVQWTVVARDGHPVSGSYSFGVLESNAGSLAGLWLSLAAGAGLLLGGALVLILKRRPSQLK